MFVNPPSRYIFGGIAPLGLLIVDLSNLTTQISGFLPIQTHVEPLAVGGMGVFWVHDELTIGVSLALFGTLKTVLEFV